MDDIAEKSFDIIQTWQANNYIHDVQSKATLQCLIMDALNEQQKVTTDNQGKFINSVGCLFAEGVEFMNKIQIYDAIKKDYQKYIMNL